MPKRSAIVASAIALALAPVAIVACGGDDDDSATTKPSGGNAAQGEQLQKGVTLTLWTMPNSPKPKEDLQKMVEPFTAKTGVKVDVQEVGWDVQFDRIRNAAVSGEGPDITQAGTTQVPFFAALGGFTDLSDRVEDIGGSGAYAEGIWNTTQVEGQEGTWAVPWFTEARSIYYRKDVLEKAGIDPATAFTDLTAFRTTLETIKEKVPDIEPFGAPGQEGLRPRPQRDAVRVGQRRRRALAGRQAGHDQLAPGARGRRVRGRADHRRPVRQEHARA